MKKVSVFLMLAMLVFAAFSYAPAASANPVPPAELNATASVSGDFKTITLTFDSSFDPADGVDLKNAITIKKTGTDLFAPLGGSDSVIFDEPKKLVLTLNAELVGDSNTIHIAADTLRIDGFDDPYASPIEVDSIVGKDITPPAYEGAESYDNGVTLYFDENFSLVFPDSIEDESAALAYLQSQIQIASDGEHFSPLVDGLVSLSWGSNYLQIDSEQDVRLVSGPKTKIKLAAGLLKDTAGNVTQELALAVSSPSILSAELSDDNHDVTVKFDRNIYPTSFIESPEDFMSRIWLQEDGNRSRGLIEADTAEIVEDQLKIHFSIALNGDSNQIGISENTLRDADGNYTSDYTVSPYLKAHADGDLSDTTGPEYVDYLVSQDLKDVTLLFNEPVKISVSDLAQFRNNLRWFDSNFGYRYGLPSDATVTVSENTVKIHFETLSGTVLYLYSELGYFTDLNGNRRNNYSEFNTAWFNSDNVQPMRLSGYFDLNGRFLSLNLISSYSDEFVDLTADEKGSHLKEKIMISTDNGVTFKPLSDEDKVIFNGSQIAIFLQNPIVGGTVQVKLEADVLMDSHHYQVNGAIQQTIAYNRPQITGYLFSDANTVLKYEDNTEWSKHVTGIKIRDRENETTRTLTAAEYTISGGKITLNKGIFLRDREYYIDVEAEGYSSQGFSGIARKSSDIFYMTSPSVTKSNGITASVFIYNRAIESNPNYNPALKVSESRSSSAGTQDVVFELFDGDTPVSIAAAELAVGTGTYTAKFNVPDATSASRNYTVKAFIVSSFDGETGDVGLSLGTVKTQSEIDEAIMLSQNNNNNYEN
ncbi:hypothetical protein OMP38_32170 [Cohnella ginsengisoli]|uniref:Heme-binding protein Shr-like Hb-interacting domain-containing protein n=1 Tax=Cohnella ginsengisoli TaxID=425004 RepID=A0A9X4KMX6_9BACL|nr:hemoblobin-interacting domain-containing protein [Cohnella ginsengisoli]MDG0794968.1 hypothetical protein [Cohnella ginsengisoli]